MTDAARAPHSPGQPSHSIPDAYRRYGPALLRKAERILQNSDDASDIVQGLFVDLMTKGTTDVELRYLYRAVTNRCLNHLRDRKNRQRLLDMQETTLRGPVRTRLDDRVLDLDLLVKLTRALDGKTLEILICRYWDDMTQQEIADFLGTSRKTVGKRLEKIRTRVTELLPASPGPSGAGGSS